MKSIKKFDDLPENVKIDLLIWNNVSDEKDLEQLERLKNLYIEGRFEAWDCPSCGNRVYHGDPDDWGYYQGTLNQDFCSYPGNTKKYSQEYLRLLCDFCRLYEKK